MLCAVVLDRCHHGRRYCSPDSPEIGKKDEGAAEEDGRGREEKAEGYYDEMKDKATEATEKVQGYYQEAKQTMESTVDAAKKTFQKAKE